MIDNYNITLFKDDLYLQKLINMQDEQTKKHAFNVSKYAVLLGKELQLESKELELLEKSAILHDVGKIYLPLSIINKCGKLTNEEYEIIKNHPVMIELLLYKEEYNELKTIIRSHHERIDGRGYSEQLKGENIPFLTEIITIADAFDAMTTDRGYNKVKTFSEALTELYNCSVPIQSNNGEQIQQFDKFLVDKFIKTITENFINNTGKVYKKKF